MKKAFIALVLVLVASFAWAQETPDAKVKRITEDVLNIIRSDKSLQNGDTNKVADLIERKVLPNFNFERMTALAIGKDWRSATPEQQARLTQQFKTLLVRTYSNALTGYKNETIRYKNFKMNPSDTQVTVQTEVLQPGGQPVQLDYSMENKNGDWKVFDVVVGGISLVTNYRNQFGQEVRNNGIEGLIKVLTEKNSSTQTRKAASK